MSENVDFQCLMRCSHLGPEWGSFTASRRSLFFTQMTDLWNSSWQDAVLVKIHRWSSAEVINTQAKRSTVAAKCMNYSGLGSFTKQKTVRVSECSQVLHAAYVSLDIYYRHCWSWVTGLGEALTQFLHDYCIPFSAVYCNWIYNFRTFNKCYLKVRQGLLHFRPWVKSYQLFCFVSSTQTAFQKSLSLEQL